MPYCREGHTLVDNEAEAGWDKLVPGTNFELVVLAVTYFCIVDEYVAPTPTTLVCRIYTDAGRTILLTIPIATGTPYEIQNFADYLHDAKDLELNDDSGMGVWRSPPVIIRDDTGVWGGNWITAPRTNDEIQLNFDGSHVGFKAIAAEPLGSEVAGAGLGAGTYTYCIVPVDASAREGAGSRKVTVVLAGAADILIDWLPDSRVDTWNVYGRIGGSIGLITNLPGATVSYLDNGAAVGGGKPPLFEDPAWTPVQPNLEVDGTDTSGNVFDAEGIEDGATKLIDGTTIADYTADGDVNLIGPGGLIFDLNNLTSHSSSRTEIVLDPNLFTLDTGPVENLPPKVISYDYHVFLDSNGDTVISEFDSGSGQTITIIVNLIDNTFDVTISDSTGVLATDSVPISPNFTIPLPASISGQTTLSNFRTLPDGTIIGDELIEMNTFEVTPVPKVGIGFFTTQNFGTPAFGEIAYTLDSGVTWSSYTIPGTRLVPPGGFTTNRQVFMRCHGDGWTVVGLVNHPTVPASVTDYSLHWTPDLTSVPWPFNDAGGRVAGGMSVAHFDSLNAFLAPTTSGGPMGTFTMRTFANGLGPVMTRDMDTQDQPVLTGAVGRDDMNFFYPATGLYHFQSPGLTKYRHYTYWREKNLLIGLEQGFVNNIWTNPIGTVDATPLGAQTFRHGITPTPTEILAIGTTKDIAYVTWKRVATSELGYSWSLDGLSWTDVVLNNTNDADYRNPGNEFLGVYPGENSDPDRKGNLIWLRDTALLTISTDNGATWSNTPAKPALTFNAWEYRPFVSGVFGEIAFAKTPFIFDGIASMVDSPNTFLFPGGSVHRMDPDDFSDLVPPTGSYSIGGGDTTEDSQAVGSTLGNLGSVNGTPAANLRRYLGRSVVIPNSVGAVPAPFVIRDTTKSAVYSSTRTKTYSAVRGSVSITIEEGPGGIGAAAIANYEDGQYVVDNIPYSSEILTEARKPKQTNMQWSAHPWGTFD